MPFACSLDWKAAIVPFKGIPMNFMCSFCDIHTIETARSSAMNNFLIFVCFRFFDCKYTKKSEYRKTIERFFALMSGAKPLALKRYNTLVGIQVPVPNDSLMILS